MRKLFAHSFTEQEVVWLKQLFTAVARGGDTSVLRRASEYATIFRKIATMEGEASKRASKAPSESRTN